MYLFFTPLHFSFSSLRPPPSQSLLSGPCNAPLFVGYSSMPTTSELPEERAQALPCVDNDHGLPTQGQGHSPGYRGGKERLPVEHLLHTWSHKPLIPSKSVRHLRDARWTSDVTGEEMGQTGKICLNVQKEDMVGFEHMATLSKPFWVLVSAQAQ